MGIKSHEVRKRLLREKALTLNTTLDIIRAAETASDQLEKIDGEIETSVHAVKYKGKNPDFTRRLETVNNVNFVKRTTTFASIGLMEKNEASVT